MRKHSTSVEVSRKEVKGKRMGARALHQGGAANKPVCLPLGPRREESLLETRI